jgi:predicted MarR family transcription regulator
MPPDSANAVTYDLRRLRLKGLVVRVHHTNTYTLTSDGLKTAIFYTKLDHRLFHPLLAADQPPAPPPLRAALATIERTCTDYIARAQLALAA